MNLKTNAYAAVIAAGATGLVLGTATPGLAKGKKKAPAEPPTHAEICVPFSSPVCGSLKGQKFTYANFCAAEKDGATVVSQKACPTKVAHKKSKKMKM